MRKVFVDTAAWLALLNVSDSLHSRAREIQETLRREGARLLTTEFVLLEVADALAAPPLREKTVAFINKLRRLKLLAIVPASSSLLAEGWTLFCGRLDKDWGLTDCISFAVMTREHISQAFTSDRHFEQAGFEKLIG